MKKFNTIALVIVLIFVGGFIFSRRIKHIQCYSQYGTCRYEISVRLEKLLNKPLFSRLTPQSISQLIGSQEPIKKINIYRRLPSTLVIALDYRQAVIRVNSAVLGLHTAADIEGFIIGSRSLSALPYLDTSQTYSPGDILDPDAHQATLILQKLSQIVGQSLQANYTPPIVRAQVNSSQVLLDVKHSSPQWYSSLQMILDRSKITNKVPKVIDLRFSQPVLSY